MTMQEKVKSYITPLYAVDLTTSNILDAGATELQNFEDNITDVLNQYFVDTATWGIANWEIFLGVKTDETKPIDQRRSVIKSKIRGSGTVTVELIKNVAEAYDNGTVSVSEDNANYKVTITFVRNHGIPPNIVDIQNALRDIIPAHLDVSYAFTYLTWDELDAHIFQWDEIDSFAMTWDEFEAWKPSDGNFLFLSQNQVVIF